RVNVPTLRAEPKSHKGLYAIVTTAALVVIALVGYAMYTPHAAAPPPAPMVTAKTVEPPVMNLTPVEPDAAKVTAQIQTLLNSSPALQHHPIAVSYANGVATLAGKV